MERNLPCNNFHEANYSKPFWWDLRRASGWSVKCTCNNSSNFDNYLNSKSIYSVLENCILIHKGRIEVHPYCVYKKVGIKKILENHLVNHYKTFKLLIIWKISLAHFNSFWKSCLLDTINSNTKIEKHIQLNLNFNSLWKSSVELLINFLE